jgi:mannose-6-phosphate isomerase-like protein (cupin superfamily)
MAPTRIERWNVHLDGPLSETSLREKVVALGFDVAARTYPAGLAGASPPDARECVTAVVRGLVKLTVDGEPSLLTAGDLAFVGAGCERRLEVVGPSPAVCLEAFRRPGA